MCVFPHYMFCERLMLRNIFLFAESQLNVVLQNHEGLFKKQFVKFKDNESIEFWEKSLQSSCFSKTVT